MDLSTQHQHQHQHHQQQTYDPSQVQTFDRSTQAYYEYHQYLQQQQYPYYTNAYQQQQQQSLQEPTSIHPPGVPIAPESTHTVGAQQGLGQTHLQNQPNLYYPQKVADPQPQQLLDSSDFAVTAGMNPSVAAAMPQFAGNIVGMPKQQWQGNSGGFGQKCLVTDFCWYEDFASV